MGRTATQRQRSPLPATQDAELKQPALTQKDDPMPIGHQSAPLPSPQKVKPELPTTTEIDVRIRAYELYLERGGVPGEEVDDWLQAERELLAD